MKLHRVLAVAALAALLTAFETAAQIPAEKLVRLIVPFPPGGIADVMARLTSEYLERRLNSRVVVDHRPGAACIVGSEALAKSAADGYTIGLINVGCVAINPWLYRNLPFDPLNDIVPITPVGESNHVLFISASLPVNDVHSLIAHAKQHPGTLNYGSAGAGTPLHLSAEYFSRIAGIRLFHVPFKGTGPIVTDLAAGRIQLVFLALAPMRGQLASGRVRALAVARHARMAALPEVPTFRELGITDFEPGSWWGIMGPRDMRGDRIAQFSQMVGEMLDDPVQRQRLQDAGIEPLKESTAQFRERVNADYRRWGGVVRDAGLKPE